MPNGSNVKFLYKNGRRFVGQFADFCQTSGKERCRGPASLRGVGASPMVRLIHHSTEMDEGGHTSARAFLRMSCSRACAPKTSGNSLNRFANGEKQAAKIPLQFALVDTQPNGSSEVQFGTSKLYRDLAKLRFDSVNLLEEILHVDTFERPLLRHHSFVLR
jgi:hypothetical protein